MRLCFIILLFGFLQLQLIYAKDYCKFKCGSVTNFACNHNEEPHGRCVAFKRLSFNKEDVRLILMAHNRRRRIIASGRAKANGGKRLPRPKDMPLLRWDKELAYLAHLNTLQCHMENDPCRDTEHHNGQNIYNVVTRKKIYPKKRLIRSAVAGWYNEIRNVRISDIKRFKGRKPGEKNIGHFTQLAWGQTRAVGCAAASYKQNGMTSFMITCNYRFGNTINKPVYAINES